MTTTETTTKARKFICVTSNNNNKFYNLFDQGNDTFIAEWGRVGSRTTGKTYPINQWEKKCREKLNKGYKDVTHIYADEKVTEDFGDILNHDIAQLVQALQSYAQKSVYENYNISSANVTQTMLDDAQTIIDNITFKINQGKIKKKELDQLLIELYTIIPRKMNNVNEHLSGKMENLDSDLKKKIAEEQATLDVMRGEGQTSEKTKNADRQKTLLEAMGITIDQCAAEDDDIIKKLMKKEAKYFTRAFKVNHVSQQKKFSRFLKKSDNKTTKLLWHGSRNENWWSILESGLVLRPANAIITGKMFGYGIYFADKVKKSMGYTSLNGSYWTGGHSSKAYLAIYDVHLGSTLKVKDHDSWMYELNQKKLKKRGDYDSLFAKGGADLMNNEYIIYHEAQTTIKYLVEITA